MQYVLAISDSVFTEVISLSGVLLKNATVIFQKKLSTLFGINGSGMICVVSSYSLAGLEYIDLSILEHKNLCPVLVILNCCLGT